MKSVIINDKKFELVIPNKQIIRAVKGIARKIKEDYKNSEATIFIGVLNGSFIFAADLLKALDIDCEVSFIKVNSYIKDQSSLKINEIIGLNENITDKDVIILEDIIDTGKTIDYIYNEISLQHPKSIKVASLFFKKEVYKGNLTVDYVGFEVSDKFIVGYGLDYDGLGRNYKDVYELSS